MKSRRQDTTRDAVDEKSVESGSGQAAGGSPVVTLLRRGGGRLGGITGIRLTVQAIRLLPLATPTRVSAGTRRQAVRGSRVAVGLALE
jgi:hypothetical protein